MDDILMNRLGMTPRIAACLLAATLIPVGAAHATSVFLHQGALNPVTDEG